LSSEYEETVQGFCHRGSIISNCFLELKLKLLKGFDSRLAPKFSAMAEY
jgi:hypothetical protein